jgi:ATP-binding cassette, subfamily B, bacterial
MDCGSACLAMVCSYYNKNYSVLFLRENSFITREGVSLLGISEASKKIGFDNISAKLTIQKLVIEKNHLPIILHWNQNHFVVLKKISKSFFGNHYYFHIADPAHGFIRLSQEKLENPWLSDDEKGVALFLSPTEEFYNTNPPKEDKLSIKYLFNYLKPYKKQLLLMFLFLLIGNGLTLIFPFLTKKTNRQRCKW